MNLSVVIVQDVFSMFILGEECKSYGLELLNGSHLIKAMYGKPIMVFMEWSSESSVCLPICSLQTSLLGFSIELAYFYGPNL